MKRFLAGAVIIVASVIGPSASASTAAAGPVASAATPIAIPVVVPVAVVPVASKATAVTPMYPPQPITVFIYLSVTIVAPGVFIHITIRFCWIGEQVTFTVGFSSATATCGGTGGVKARGLWPLGGRHGDRVPAGSRRPGTYTVTGAAGTSGATASAPLTVTAPLLSEAVAKLTSSGPGNTRTVWIGRSALLAGIGLAGVATYRRRPGRA